MNKLLKKFAILGVLTLGLFFTAFDATSKVGASNVNCRECAEIASECNTYEEGSPGYAWCVNRVERCYRICRW